jgi:small-conductance mechanosensitive channel
MSSSSKNSKDGRQLQKMIKIMEIKSLLLTQCINGNIISIIMFWKNISIISAIIYYRRYFNFTPEIKTKLKLEIKHNIINYSGYVSLISIVLTILFGIISGLFLSAFFTLLAIIMGILFFVFGSIYFINMPN